jgi:hypothetical protein
MDVVGMKIHDFKILQPVIGLVAVPVMDHLGRACHQARIPGNHPVFKD